MGLGPKSNVDSSWINYWDRDAVYCRIGPIGLLGHEKSDPASDRVL